MRRTALGIIAVASVALAAVCFSVAQAHPSGGLDGFASSALRVGVLLGLIWLALPNLQRLPQNWVMGTLAALLIIAIQPKLVLYAVVALFAVAFLRSRWKLG